MRIKDTEVALSDIAFQAAVIFPERKNLEKRVVWKFIQGYWRVFAHIVMVSKKAIFSLFSKHRFGLKDNIPELILITASYNQLNLARRVLPYLKIDSRIHLHYSGWGREAVDAVPIYVSLKNLPYYICYLIVCFWENRIEIRQLHLKTRQFCLEKICEVFLLKFFLEQSNLTPKIVIIFTDLSPFGNLTAKFFNKNSKIIYIPHSPMLQNYKSPSFYDVVIGMSQKDMNDRKKRVKGSKNKTSKIEFNWSDFRDKSLSKGAKLLANNVGICLKPEDNIRELVVAFGHNFKMPGALVCRPHPMYKLSNTEKLLLKRKGFKLSDPLTESAEEFIMQCSILAGRDSGIFAEGLAHKRHIKILTDNHFTDNYGIKDSDNVDVYNSWASIAKALSNGFDYAEFDLKAHRSRVPFMSSLEDIFRVE